MSGRPVSFLLRRYIVPREGNLLSMALWICVGGVALGIALLMLVLAVMSGFQNFLRTSYTRITSDLVVLPRHSQAGTIDIKKELATHKEIAAFTPFGLSQVMLFKQGVAGVTIEGIDEATSPKVTNWDEVWVTPPDKAIQAKTADWIWLGNQVAAKLGAKVGDTVDLLVAEGNTRKTISFTVSAITRFGIYDHDLRYARVSFKTLERLFPQGPGEPLYKIRLVPGTNEKRFSQKLKDRLDRSANVRLWSEIHQNIFLAVEHQKRMLFVVLEIIVALAAMNLVNLLLMSAHQRKRDIAILRAMGMKLSQVFRFYLWQGTIVGIVGTVAGVFLGYGLCAFVERYQPELLSESIYNVTKLPIRVEIIDVAAICIAALGLCLVFSVWPALRAARARPVEALRYE